LAQSYSCSCDFSLRHYFKTLYDYILAEYVIIPNANAKRHVHLRHDVDMSLDAALELAKEENRHDMSATYYIMLHSDLYNATSPESMKQIREIKNLGHQIGLHIDTRYYLPNDFDTLTFIVGSKVTDWRRHFVNLTPEFGIPEPRPDGYKYISDSARNWREGCFCKQIGKYNKMEILTHPEWWIVSPQGNMNKYLIMEEVKSRAKETIDHSFRDFKNIVHEYEQTINLHPQSEKRPAV